MFLRLQIVTVAICRLATQPATLRGVFMSDKPMLPLDVLRHCQRHPGCKETRSCTICDGKPKNAGPDWVAKKIQEVRSANAKNS